MKINIYLSILCCILIFKALPANSYTTNFEPRLNISETYSDNLFLDRENRQHDFITVIAPEFLFEITGSDKSAAVSYSPASSIYDRFKRYNTIRHHAQFSGSADVARNTRIEIGDSFERTEDPVQEDDTQIQGAAQSADTEQIQGAAQSQDATIRRNRNPYYTNSASLQLISQIGANDRFSFGFEHGLLKNEDPEVEDNQNYAATVEFVKQITDEIGLVATGAYTKGEYEGAYSNGEYAISDGFDELETSLRISKQLRAYLDAYIQYLHIIRDYEGFSENYTIYEPSIGLSYLIDQDTRISVGAAYYVQNWDHTEDEKEISLNSDIHKGWVFPRGTLSIDGSSGFQQADFGAEQLGMDMYHSAGIDVSYDLSRFLTYTLAGEIRRDEYINANPDRIDVSYLATSRFTYQVNEWLGTQLEYSFNKVSSNVDENEYKENRVILELTLMSARR